MVLESTMICLDNSDYQRNGDYMPTRLQVQKEGINLVCLTKVRANPENNVGLMTLSNTVEVLTTLTTDVNRIYSKMHAVQPKGEINLLTGIRIAHLVLKHRQGKNHKMRIVLFVGSPIKNNENELIQIAKRLKKEKVNVDIVSFGGHENNDELLQALINTLNGKDGSGSHLLSVPRGSPFCDALLLSPIIQGEDGLGGSGLTASGYEFGFDPNEDPELALALRVSMEEERQREAERQRAANAAATGAGTASGTGASNETNSEEALLQRALAISNETPIEDLPDFANMTEEEQIAFAMQMSMQEAAPNETAATSAKSSEGKSTTMEVDIDADANVNNEYADVIENAELLQNVLENLPGVDPESEALRDAVDSLKDNGNRDKKNNGKDNTKK